MTLVMDSGPLVALGDRNDRDRARVRQVVRSEPGSLMVPLTVVTEVDYLLGVRGGRRARLAFLGDLRAGRFEVVALGAEDWTTILDLEDRYADLDAGLADLSVVVAADRAGTDRICTFDEHFRVLRPLTGKGAFTILP